MAPEINPIAIFSGFSNPLRFKLMQMMADGEMLSATQAAAVLKRDIDIVIKHLRILSDAGLVRSKYSQQDARFKLYYIPQAWRPRPGVLDLGFLRFASAAIAGDAHDRS